MENTGEEKHFVLKSPLELGAMSQDDLINYVDQLHWIIKDYQIVVDTAILKNKAVKS